MAEDSTTDDEGEASECKGNCPRTSRSARNKAKEMNCAQILAKIDELTDTEKVGRAGPKGLLQRFRDFKGDDPTHPGNIEDQQASLRSYMQAYKDKGCGDPPQQAQQMADKPLPAPQPSSGNNTAKTVAVAGGAMTAGYVGYRVVRMLPSLFPFFWETIPLNLAVP